MKQWCCVAAQTKNAQNVQINLNSRCREENHQLQDQRAKSCMSPKWCLGVGRCCPGGSPTPTVWHPPPKTPTHSDTHTGTYCAPPSHNLTLVTLVPPFLHLTTATHISYLTPRTVSLPYGHCFAVSLLRQCNVWSKTHAWPWNVCLLLTTGPMPKHFKMTKKCDFLRLPSRTGGSWSRLIVSWFCLFGLRNWRRGKRSVSTEETVSDQVGSGNRGNRGNRPSREHQTIIHRPRYTRHTTKTRVINTNAHLGGRGVVQLRLSRLMLFLWARF